ncbi:18172_t:CDS:2 [Entrophospora sp. SA101]|nr:18172_t:CDS:2 [Entrophospora sp. SA101]
MKKVKVGDTILNLDNNSLPLTFSFSKLNGILDGQRKTKPGEAKPYDTLTNQEVKLILDHNFCSPNNLTGHRRWFYAKKVSDQGSIEGTTDISCYFKELLIEVESPRIDLKHGSNAGKEKDMTFTLAVCEIVHPKISDSDNTLRNSYEKY